MQEQLQQLERKAKQNEEKFLKMKEVYTKLREEHIGLLRAKAELEKKVHQQSTDAAQHSQVLQEPGMRQSQTFEAPDGILVLN